MRRDPRLHGLSSEHHRALVLARELARAGETWTARDGEALHQRFERELEPHFRVEEEVLIPSIREAGAGALAARTLADHAWLRAAVAAARKGDGRAARDLGERLQDHVRFEERELFPTCEAMLPGAVLDAAARRAPKAT